MGDINYTRGKLPLALMALALGEGDFRNRVKDAYEIISRCSCQMGFEAEFENIERITGKVYQGDWTSVTNAGMKEIALLIWQMNERLDSGRTEHKLEGKVFP